jgi:hypothetical protein
MQSNRYTSNGHSHTSLLRKAKQLKASKPILSLNKAKNQIAQSIGFKNWKSIEQELKNSARESFFNDAFSHREKYSLLYKQYLEESQVDQTMQTYRDFVVEHYKKINSKKLDSVVVK